MKTEKCEYCNKDAECDVNMPLEFGIFKARLCIECSLKIHEDKKMLLQIITDRAKKLKIPLPTSIENMRKIINREDIK